MEFAEVCKKCPRRGSLRQDIVTRALVINLVDWNDPEVQRIPDVKEQMATMSVQMKEFYDGRQQGGGLTDQFPPNTELEDFDRCVDREVAVRSRFLRLPTRYECGAFNTALTRAIEAGSRDTIE